MYIRSSWLIDLEPAQAQVATNRLGYILLKQINDGAIKGNALLNFTYELVEMTAGQGSYLFENRFCIGC
jgi:hypothetical protein